MDNNDVDILLHEVAHARTGDKGDTLNISIFPYNNDAYPYILEQITIDRIRVLLAHRKPGQIRRYEMKSISGINFVIDKVLEGGVNQSLNLDGHGKTLSYLVLSLKINIPKSLVKMEKLRSMNSSI